jgi:hypothetical protein
MGEYKMIQNHRIRRIELPEGFKAIERMIPQVSDLVFCIPFQEVKSVVHADSKLRVTVSTGHGLTATLPPSDYVIVKEDK